MCALPTGVVNNYNRKIDDALDLIPRVHEADCLENATDRSRALAELGDEILRRNQMIFFSGVANQAFPRNRSILAGGGSTRWDGRLMCWRGQPALAALSIARMRI